MHVLLDTNIYLADITFGKPEHEALRNYLQTAHGHIVMPHVVKGEVEKNIKSKAQSEINKLQQLYSVSLGLIADTPSHEQLEESIKDKFILGLHRNRIVDVGYGDITLEAVTERSLLETPPFKSKGRGFRDALIWYSLLEYLRANPEHKVAFITDNTQDFGVGSLKAELVAELAELGFQERVVYFQSLNEFLAEYSEPIAFINDEFVEASINDEVESYAESVDESDLDIDYPSRDAEWNVTELVYEEAVIENYYIYRTTGTHYYLYVEVSLNFYVGLECHAYEWGYDHMSNDWDYQMKYAQDHTSAYTTCEFELKVNKLTHAVGVIS